MKQLKKILTVTCAFLTLAAILLIGTACDTEDTRTPEEIWQEDAIYREDTSFGTGSKTFSLTVRFESYAVTFTVKTDRDTVGAALVDHALLEGEQGAYGLYVKKVNGILADYDIDKSYWSLQQNGEELFTGVDSTPLTDGATYEFVYKK